MKTKRFLAALLAVMMLVSTFAFSASANNNTDVNFYFDFNSGYICEDESVRLKTDTSSSYVNYNTTTTGGLAQGPYKIQVFIYGSDNYSTGFVDCTSYTSTGLARTPAYVTKGTEGLVRQDVYEEFSQNGEVSCWGKIYGKLVTGYSADYATGCWSVDSVGTYQYYNRVA